jgi:hypothetical protein
MKTLWHVIDSTLGTVSAPAREGKAKPGKTAGQRTRLSQHDTEFSL